MTARGAKITAQEYHTGVAYPTGEATYWIDDSDELGTGFSLR